ncbi:MAG: glycosyltransferase family A protein [Candidatus Jorgensenbacteria bacterium]|nr:glycosyltransferase family A protein [Candidatus Jorgensenbacteria bacterium]
MGNGDASDKNPLVSICATFFNAERYIYRFLESCLNQTYKNIEIVILDDASTDNSEKIIREYAGRDSRIKYYKNETNIRLAESLLKLFKLAKGDFSTMIGADDWLARDYVENGVRSFLKHPESAGVIPKVVSLFETRHNVFQYDTETDFPSRTYSAEWFMKHMYHPIFLYISGFALVRSSDLVSGEEYHVKNYCRNTSESVPEELRGFFKRGYGTDSVLFPEILTRYKNFVFDNSMSYIKITHGGNQSFDSSHNSIYEIFKEAYYFLLIYTLMYKPKWPRFYKGMKIFRGAEVLSTVYIHIFRCHFRLSFLNISKSRKLISGFFSDFSFFEIVATVAYSIPMAIHRCFGGMKRMIIKNNPNDEAPRVFVKENFLSKEGNFTIAI